MMEYRNPMWNARGGIDCEINSHRFGWIPTTLTRGDAGATYDVGALMDQIEAAGGIAPYVPPPEPTPEELLAQERASMVCSPAQMRLSLLSAGLLDQVQGIADSDPAASIVWEYATRIERLSPLVDALGGPNGFSPEQIDDIFRAAMQVQV